ncbi:tyrosine-type recombinase/integrase [Methylopila sp. M107]|uniref:tyrosine-type recombinase/integrase n=1 Tax=Methylopila sp. M107 TaxID=1101190 RepID=UPI00037A174E|nr:tyrosine-type recombinase/integrase [Methylopila sp. M107]
MTRAGVQTKILDPYADRPGAAHAILKMLRVLLAHGISRGWITFDPTAGIRRPKLGEVRSWTDAEISQFEARWPTGSKERTAFALHLFTGQRRSDVHRMTWGDIADGEIQVVQQKTGEKLWVAMHRELIAVLAAAPREHVTILNTAFGKPFTVAGFGNFLRSAITTAGLPLDAQPHGLRKAAGRRLAEAGCTANEIMSVLGHKSLAEAERYTRDADRRRLGKSAITKLEGRTKNRNAQTASGRFGKTPKT